MLSKKAQYAFHALTYLAQHRNRDQPIQCGEIAESRGISQKFLEHILSELKRGRIIASKQGKLGGYYLREAPESVHLARVIRLIDGPIALLPCVSLNYYESCEHCDEHRCGLNRVMAEVRDSTLAILERKTLVDILPRQMGADIN